MTHSTVNTEAENAASTDVVYHTIDITSLDAAGQENYSPRDELGIDGADRFGVHARGQADASYVVSWDHVNGHLDVKNMADGTDVTSGTAVGEVVLEVTGL